MPKFRQLTLLRVTSPGLKGGHFGQVDVDKRSKGREGTAKGGVRRRLWELGRAKKAESGKVGLGAWLGGEGITSGGQSMRSGLPGTKGWRARERRRGCEGTVKEGGRRRLWALGRAEKAESRRVGLDA